METYIGTYKVIKMNRYSGRRSVLARGLTRAEAQEIVSSFSDSNRSMVFFQRQFRAKKYFVKG